MSTPVALLASISGKLPILLGWLCGALFIVAVFLLNHIRLDRTRK